MNTIKLTLATAALSLTVFSAERPNVIIIYGDDVGYSDVGDWKYIAEGPAKNKGKGAELYNLKKDSSEKKNLIKDYPEKADALAKQLIVLMNASGVR